MSILLKPQVCKPTLNLGPRGDFICDSSDTNFEKLAYSKGV